MVGQRSAVFKGAPISQSFLQLLPPEARTISLVGAGGKTSLLFALAQGFAAAGERVLTTTTTKIFPPAPAQSRLVLHWDGGDLAPVRDALAQHAHVTVVQGLTGTGEKCLGLAPEAVDRLQHAGLADRILIEADGAARRPLKIPAAHEPVIPASTDCCIGVMGLSALGRPFGPETVFRHELAAPILESSNAPDVKTSRTGDSRISPLLLAALAAHPQGLFKGCPEGARRITFCNKADALEEDQAGMAATLQEAIAGLPPCSPESWAFGAVHEGWFIWLKHPAKSRA